MKTKFITLFLALAASAGTTFASVTIDGIAYNLNETELTAEVTSGGSYSGNIVIPESVLYDTKTYSVTSIGNYAFCYCTGLTSVTIPNSVTSIGVRAFYGCTGLTSVIIGNSVTSIGNYAFYQCSSLTSVTIPNSVTSIGTGAFQNCSGLTSVTIGNSVTSIGTGAFQNCSGLTSVTIPNSVTSIGDRAFYGCSGLTSPVYNAHVFAFMPTSYSGAYTIPDGIESIGDLAFEFCRGLTSIEIPNSVTSIGGGAFFGCESLTSVTIPNSVTSIGSSAFSSCSGLTTVIWNAKNYADFASKNTPFYVDYYDEEWGQYIRFDLRPQITSFTFGNEVEHIPANLCNGMSNLTSVTIPNSVTSIGSSAFSSCSGLTSVIWNAKNCADFASNNIPFYDLRSLITSFTFGNEVEHIPAYLCNGMSNLTSIEIPNSVTSIGDYAFFGCESLTSVTIPNSVTSIGSSAFSSCSGLTTVTIPSSVTSIGYGAFYKCTGLTSVTIGNSVTSIGDYAFQYCTGLSSVEAPAVFFDVPEKDWPSYTKNLNQVIVNGGELTENALLFINRSYKTLQTLDVSGVTNTEFADEAFKGYYNLQQLVLPEGLQKVGYMMVAGCKNLQSINIPASVEEIEQSAFEDCRSIKSITFGGSSAGAPGRFNAPATASQLKKIGNWAFYNAHELQHLDIPEGVTEIGDGAFYGCTYLENLTLPASVQSIGDNTFALCAKLQKIVVNSVTPPSIQAKTFFDVKRQTPVYVPDEAVSAYENDTYWQEFDIQGISNMPMGIDNTTFPSGEGRGEARKVLRDSQIFILRGEKEYTLTGQEVR